MWNYENYKNWLVQNVTNIAQGLNFKDYSFEVYNEVDYAKERSLKKKVITIVIKLLPSTIVFTAKVQPIQMLVITEENSLAVANSVFTTFAERFNFAVESSGATYVKHQYSTPTVLSNFNLVGVGYRSVLYINTTLYILEGVMDINGMTVDGNEIDVLSATIGYTMSGDTQPFGGGLAVTEKNFATLVMTVNTPCVSNAFTNKCIGIMKGNSAERGNEVFAFSFNVGTGTQAIPFAINMKLVGATISTAINNTPSLQLSFSV